MAEREHHLHLNGLSIGGGGGYTVGYELLRHLAIVRPAWRVSLSLIEGHPLHEEMRHAALPANASILWAPSAARGQLARWRYERRDLPDRLAREGVTGVIQLNGQLVPGLRIPTLCHFQDPFPYRFDLLPGLKGRLVAAMKRRLHAQSLRHAAGIGFTSAYLRDLVCGFHGAPAARASVFYNGVPDAWIERVRAGAPPWDDRPMELLTVSNVAPYKQQHLVIRALAELRRRPGFQDLCYRIVGHCDSAYRQELGRLADQLGVGAAVIVEGRVPSARVEWAYARARCFVLMSLCESFGLPAIEAMTFGTPVVVADSSALPEVVGDAAVIAPPQDVPALADAIAAALDPSWTNDLRRRGQERVQAFRWRDTAEAMAQWCETVGHRQVGGTA